MSAKSLQEISDGISSAKTEFEKNPDSPNEFSEQFENSFMSNMSELEGLLKGFEGTYSEFAVKYMENHMDDIYNMSHEDQCEFANELCAGVGGTPIDEELSSVQSIISEAKSLSFEKNSPSDFTNCMDKALDKISEIEGRHLAPSENNFFVSRIFSTVDSDARSSLESLPEETQEKLADGSPSAPMEHTDNGIQAKQQYFIQPNGTATDQFGILPSGDMVTGKIANDEIIAHPDEANQEIKDAVQSIADKINDAEGHTVVDQDQVTIVATVLFDEYYGITSQQDLDVYGKEIKNFEGYVQKDIDQSDWRDSADIADTATDKFKDFFEKNGFEYDDVEQKFKERADEFNAGHDTDNEESGGYRAGNSGFGKDDEESKNSTDGQGGNSKFARGTGNAAGRQDVEKAAAHGDSGKWVEENTGNETYEKWAKVRNEMADKYQVSPRLLYNDPTYVYANLVATFEAYGSGIEVKGEGTGTVPTMFECLGAYQQLINVNVIEFAVTYLVASILEAIFPPGGDAADKDAKDTERQENMHQALLDAADGSSSGKNDTDNDDPNNPPNGGGNGGNDDNNPPDGGGGGGGVLPPAGNYGKDSADSNGKIGGQLGNGDVEQEHNGVIANPNTEGNVDNDNTADTAEKIEILNFDQVSPPDGSNPNNIYIESNQNEQEKKDSVAPDEKQQDQQKDIENKEQPTDNEHPDLINQNEGEEDPEKNTKVEPGNEQEIDGQEENNEKVDSDNHEANVDSDDGKEKLKDTDNQEQQTVNEHPDSADKGEDERILKKTIENTVPENKMESSTGQEAEKQEGKKEGRVDSDNHEIKAVSGDEKEKPKEVETGAKKDVAVENANADNEKQDDTENNPVEEASAVKDENISSQDQTASGTEKENQTDADADPEKNSDSETAPQGDITNPDTDNDQAKGEQAVASGQPDQNMDGQDQTKSELEQQEPEEEQPQDDVDIPSEPVVKEDDKTTPAMVAAGESDSEPAVEPEEDKASSEFRAASGSTAIGESPASSEDIEAKAKDAVSNEDTMQESSALNDMQQSAAEISIAEASGTSNDEKSEANSSNQKEFAEAVSDAVKDYISDPMCSFNDLLNETIDVNGESMTIQDAFANIDGFGDIFASAISDSLADYQENDMGNDTEIQAVSDLIVDLTDYEPDIMDAVFANTENLVGTDAANDLFSQIADDLDAYSTYSLDAGNTAFDMNSDFADSGIDYSFYTPEVLDDATSGILDDIYNDIDQFIIGLEDLQYGDNVDTGLSESDVEIPVSADDLARAGQDNVESLRYADDSFNDNGEAKMAEDDPVYGDDSATRENVENAQSQPATVEYENKDPLEYRGEDDNNDWADNYSYNDNYDTDSWDYYDSAAIG